METVNEMYPSYINVLSSPPLILDQGGYTDDVFENLLKKIKDVYTEFSDKFIPDGLLDSLKEIFDSYEDGHINKVHLAQAAIHLALLWVPGGSAIGWYADKVIGIFFTKDEPSLFDQIKDAVEAMIDQKLISYDIATLLANLNGMKHNMGNLVNAMQSAMGKPAFLGYTNSTVESVSTDATCDATLTCEADPDKITFPLTDGCSCMLNSVHTTYQNNDVENIILGMEKSLDSVLSKDDLQSYLQVFLPLYSLASTLAITYHKTYIQFAKRYNFGLDEKNNTTIIAMTTLRTVIQKRSNFLHKTFLNHVPPVSKDSSNTKGAINAYAQYTRNIAINALDTAATWPLLDEFDYSMPATHSLSRVVLNDIVGPVECSNSPGYPKQDAKKLTLNYYGIDGKPSTSPDPIHPFYNNIQLKSLQFQRYDYSATGMFAMNYSYPIGFKASYVTNGNDINVDTTKGSYGYKGSKLTLGDDVYKTYPNFNLLNMNSMQTSGQISTDVANIVYIPVDDLTLTCSSHNNPVLAAHSIQAIYPVTVSNPKSYDSYNNTDKLGFLTTLIPGNTTTNLVGSDGGIYTFPAEQATNPDQYDRVVEYTNGTAALILPPGKTASYSIDTTNMHSQKYQIRVHASTSGGRLEIQTSNQQKITIDLTDTSQTPGDPVEKYNNTVLPRLKISGNQGQYAYMLFPPTDVNDPNNIPQQYVVTIDPNSNTQVTIVNTGSNPVALNRIEFVPTQVQNLVDHIPMRTIPFGGESYTVWENLDVIGFQAMMTINTGNLGSDVYSVEFLLSGKSQSLQPMKPGTFSYDPVPEGFDQIRLVQSDTSQSHFVDIEISVYGKKEPHKGGGGDFSDPIYIENIDIGSNGKKIIWQAQGSKVGTSVNLVMSNTQANTAPGEKLNFYLNGTLQDSASSAGAHPWPLKKDVPQGFDTVELEATGWPYTGSVTGTVSGTASASSIIFTDPIDLKNITTFVKTFFTSSEYTDLAQHVSSYQLDQAAMKVDALSSILFSKEKMVLRKLVTKAKQLMAARNLLVNGDFASDQGWLYGTLARVANDSPLFTCNYLLLKQRSVPLSSYAYQKIEESKLKPYTRYKVSGFVAQSKGLKLVVSRYGKEIDKQLNVPYADALPLSADANPNCCQSNSCPGENTDSHFFSYSIDVGALHPELNPGIGFGLLVKEANGMAKVGNLEIVEERPLTEQEVKVLQRKEQKWKTEVENEWKKISALLQPIKNQLNSFFKNGDWNGAILPHVTYQDIYNFILPQLPNLQKWLTTNIPEEFAVTVQQIKQAIERVLLYLEERNLLHNGNFTEGLTNWIAEGEARVIDGSNGNLALELVSWGTTVSQAINISDFDEDKEYMLRVYGKGKGIVTVQHGEETETISFDTNQFTGKEHTFYFDAPSFILDIQSECEAFTIDSVEVMEVSDEDE